MKTNIIKLFLITSVLHLSQTIEAQNLVTISGVITAFENCPLNMATIKSVKTGNLAQSDSIGRFKIDCLDNDFLIFSAAGFVGKKVRVKNFKQIYINLSYRYSETSFDDAVKNKHITGSLLEHAISKYPNKGQKDYSKYQSIYELVQYEFNTLRVSGTNIYNKQTISFSLSSQVLYVVDDMVVSDISFVSPVEVKKIEFLDGPDATAYGVRGANGVLKITLRNN